MSQGYLKVALSMRMAHLRKPDGQNRGNPNSEKKTTAPPKALMPSSSMSWTMPTFPVGEDATTQERHLKQLHLEMKKVNPNKHITQELMLRTFSTRRQE